MTLLGNFRWKYIWWYWVGFPLNIGTAVKSDPGGVKWRAFSGKSGQLDYHTRYSYAWACVINSHGAYLLTCKIKAISPSCFHMQYYVCVCVCVWMLVFTGNAYERNINITSAKPWILFYFFPSSYFYEILRMCLKEHICVYKEQTPAKWRATLCACLHSHVPMFIKLNTNWLSFWPYPGPLVSQLCTLWPIRTNQSYNEEKHEPPFGFQWSPNGSWETNTGVQR